MGMCTFSMVLVIFTRLCPVSRQCVKHHHKKEESSTPPWLGVVGSHVDNNEEGFCDKLAPKFENLNRGDIKKLRLANQYRFSILLRASGIC
ncbi:hypothetical protein KIN20_015342 [Parelaphostrongylus tenuis]|uniref:Secreted protein n=1 Tax=Parelaphostrongylus tenuis TaxID=148309 RepID=A0AAD5N080_PARTN|nr:hypothetical protein KIN20_015342 [Parelaphostrongylus tenuis]